MKCPTCINEGLKSEVTPDVVIAASRVYFNEDGEYVQECMALHVSEKLICSNGHEWRDE